MIVLSFTPNRLDPYVFIAAGSEEELKQAEMVAQEEARYARI